MGSAYRIHGAASILCRIVLVDCRDAVDVLGVSQCGQCGISECCTSYHLNVCTFFAVGLVWCAEPAAPVRGEPHDGEVPVEVTGCMFHQALHQYCIFDVHNR